jgi:nucleotide-binding universal stress UspA family protein
VRVLVAIDGSEGSLRAVQVAAQFARELQGELIIIHVIGVREPHSNELDEYGRWEHVTPGEYLSDVSEHILADARQRAERLGVSGIRCQSPAGEIAETIVETAQRNHADMIVLGKRGLGRLSGLVLGSVSQKVVSVAHCTVVVVP